MSATYADLSDKVVLVTGGANGIGASLVRSFSEQGARVFFCDQDKKRGAALSKALGNRVGFHLVDLKRKVRSSSGSGGSRRQWAPSMS